MRTARTNGSTTYSYIYNGSSLSQMTVVTEITENGATTTETEILDFTYDASGTPLAVTYNDTTYYYSTNLQGDVVAILNSAGTAVVSYTYNAWGEILTIEGSLASTLGAANPLTYRGYVYDHETSLYYLQSRYYNPTIGRFLNADVLVSTGQGILGNNMFAYCNNNPVMCTDRYGDTPEWIGNILTGIGIAAGTALFVGAIVASAGAVAALVSVGAAAVGLSTGAIATASTIATVATYGVASGVALFGASDSIEAASGGTNPIRDYVLGGNQSLYDTASGCFNTLGSAAVTAGMVAPKVVQTIAGKGTPKYSKGTLVGHSLDFFDRNGDWSYRIDATTHGNPDGATWHYNPHYHVVDRGGKGNAVFGMWETIKRWFSR